MKNHAIVLSIFLFSLSSQAETIPQVVVNSKSQKELSSVKIILNRQEIQQQGSLQLSDVLQNLSQIQLKDSTGNGSQVTLSMRGFGSNAGSNSLILLNNAPLNNADLAPINLSNIPIRQIERIEIIAGSEGIIYGDQAVGGVINIFTSPKKDGSQISCSAGSYALENCMLSVAKHLSQLSYDFTLLNNATDNYREHNRYTQTLLAGQAGYKTDNASTLLRMQLAQENMQYPGALTLSQVREDRRQASNQRDYFADWNENIQLIVDKKINSNWKFSNTFMQNSMHGHGILFSEFTQNRHSYFWKPQLIMQTENWRSINGIDAQADDYELQSSYGINQERQIKFGVFNATTYALNDNIKLNAGVRFAAQHSLLNAVQRIENTNRAGIFSLGMMYNPRPNLQVYLRRAGSFRFPKAEENAATDNNLPLKTQRGASYEGGIKWIKNNFETNLNIYQLNLQQEIAFDPTQTPSAPFGSNRNLPATERLGLSLHEKILVSQYITINGFYDALQARFHTGVNAGKRIPQVAEQVIRANLNYKFSENLNFYVEGLFTSTQYAANDDANQTHPTGGNAIYNCNLNYTYQQITASLRVNNILNKQYYLYSLYQPGSESEYFYPAAERNFTFTVSYNFA